MPSPDKFAFPFFSKPSLKKLTSGLQSFIGWVNEKMPAYQYSDVDQTPAWTRLKVNDIAYQTGDPSSELHGGGANGYRAGGFWKQTGTATTATTTLTTFFETGTWYLRPRRIYRITAFYPFSCDTASERMYVELWVFGVKNNGFRLDMPTATNHYPAFIEGYYYQASDVSWGTCTAAIRAKSTAAGRTISSGASSTQPGYISVQELGMADQSAGWWPDDQLISTGYDGS